jgi:undecaprenyl diphosphate synthase
MNHYDMINQDNDMDIDTTPTSSARIPRHVAIVMDGNGRWAKKRFMPRSAGHQAGVGSVRKTVQQCLDKGIATLTLFAFSSENWQRPAREVTLLLELFLITLDKETEKLHRNGVRLHVIGDRSAFPPALQDRIKASETRTRHNARLNLAIAVNYGGRWDICQATRKIAAKIEQGELIADEVTESIIAAHLSLAGFPEPDLFIRTGGEQRISNFLLWQMAYSEFYFTPVLWPDFDEQAFGDALADYANRQRRFGRTSEQVQTPSD